MPVPTVSAPQLTPLPQVNPGIAGQPGRVVENAGDTLSQIGDLGLQVANQLRRTQNDGLLLDAKNKIDGDLIAAEDGLKTWTDYTSADKLKQQTAENLKAKYAELYQGKPYLMRHIEPYLNGELNSYNRSVDMRAGTLTVNANKGILIDAQLNAESNAANEATIEGKEKVWSQQDALTDMMVANGTMRADEGEVAKRLLRTRTIDTEVARASNPTNSPEAMQAELEKLKEYAGKGYIDPEKLEQMQDHLAASMERAQTRADRVDVAKEGDAAIAGYRSNPAMRDPETGQFDPGKAAAAVGSDDSLTTKQKKYVREEFEQEDTARKKAENDRDQKILDHEDANVESGKTTHAQIAARENLPPSDPNWLPRRVADHLMTRAAQVARENRVENMQERGELRQERAEKSASIMSDLLTEPGLIADKSELSQYIMKGLSHTDAATVWAMKGVDSSKDYENAKAMMIHSSIYPDTDAGRLQMTQDLTQLRTTVEARKLTGTQIADEAAKIIKPKQEAHTKSVVKGLLDQISNSWFFSNGNAPRETTPQVTTVPPRDEYFKAMKKANPAASDEAINKYLDDKGVK